MAKLSWLEIIRPHLETYFTLPRGQRDAFARDLAARFNLRTNTVQRQLLAAKYLRERGLNEIHAPLLSVEAIARVGRYSRREELDLLQSLANGAETTEFYRQRAEAAAQRRFGALTMIDSQKAKTFTLDEALDHLRTLPAEHLRPLRSRLKVSEEQLRHPAGLVSRLTTSLGESIAIFNLPFRPFGTATTAQCEQVERELALSVINDAFSIIFCPFEFDVVKNFSVRLNARNRPFVHVFNAMLDPDALPALGQDY